MTSRASTLPSALPALAALAAAALGCTQETVTVDVRSLERSGRSAFMCLAAPSTAPGLPITGCSRRPASSTDDYGVDEEGNTTLPHLYALVTQTTRGEVAVIDVSSELEPVLDLDPTVPGKNFLHVGAQPIDIVATPGGTAAFVTVAEVGREGIFALPSTKIRPCAGCAAPRLSSWPACSLPSAPGEMIIVADPPGPDGERASCDAPYGDVEPAGPNGDISREELGRQKLIVTMPDLGGFIVVDAQELLDREPGSFDACLVERWVELQVDPGVTSTPPQQAPSAACVYPEAPPAAGLPIGDARPAGLAFSRDRLYIADYAAPVIHVVDLPTPCEPEEQAPLQPTSIEDPSRLVTTSRLAVSPSATPSFRRYLYAVDEIDGSTMVFDISDGAAERTPLRRPHAELNPFQTADRIRFLSPVRDLVIVERDVPATHPATGVAPDGLRCDPDPSLTVCSEGSASCDLETLYRTSSNYQSGAGPLKLRGTFAFVMLTSGQIAIIDIDDLDAACRVPSEYSAAAGCPPYGRPPDFVPPPGATSGDVDADGVPDEVDSCPYDPNPYVLEEVERDRLPGAPTRTYPLVQVQPDADGDGVGDPCDPDEPLLSSDEASCNVVLPHAPRSAVYITSDPDAGRHQPGLQSFPLLFDRAGTSIPFSDEESPIMRATLPRSDSTGLELAVGTQDPVPISASGLASKDGREEHTLVMNLEDPRAHVVDQPWLLVYEGALPGFSGSFAELRLNGGPDDGLYDPNSRFCSRGVQSEASLLTQLPPGGVAGGGVGPDLIQIASDLPAEEDAHWDGAACTFEQCIGNVGTASSPTALRELPIIEAYQDRVLVEAPPEDARQLLKCCFPGLVQFNVRPQGQWVALSEGTGFLHHVIPDPATGACRNSCEPTQQLRNGRIIPAPPCTRSGESVDCAPVVEGSRVAFKNPMFRLAISSGVRSCTSDADCPATPCAGGRCEVPPQRDMHFQFLTNGSFPALIINLAAGITDIQPQSIRHVPATGELAITDGSLEGLLLVNPGSLDVSRQFF